MSLMTLWSSDLPISNKISRSILFSTIFSLIVATVAIVAYELFNSRRSATEELVTLAKITGANSTGALAFGDTVGAEKILGNLQQQPDIIGARLYKTDGSVFATYSKPGQKNVPFPDAPGPDQEVIASRHLMLLREIRFREDPIGTIYLVADIQRVYRRLWRYVGILALMIASVVPLAFFLSSRLRRLISNPIRNLANVAHEIALEKKYSIRAPAGPKDEVGLLTQSFNQMLDTIEERDQRLVQQAEELWRSNRELEQFAYVSSHDLQEPLRKISMYSQLLESKGQAESDPDIKKYIENIYVSVSRMRALINDLLAYSRLTRQDIPTEKVDLNQNLRDVLGDMESTIAEKKAVITNDPLPVVMANLFQMQQLFQNLLSNAIKFHGQDPPRIHISCEQQGREWLLSVRDNGIGIDPKYREQIFKVFQRLHGREIYPGTGIGLAICKKIVEQNHGKIWVESEVNRGSTFFFTLPVLTAQAAEHMAESA